MGQSSWFVCSFVVYQLLREFNLNGDVSKGRVK